MNEAVINGRGERRRRKRGCIETVFYRSENTNKSVSRSHD